MSAGLETGGVVVVNDGAAGEGPVAVLVRVDGDGVLCPVEEVFGGGVSPVHVAPVPAVGVVLVKEVPFALVIDKAVGVVEPAAVRSEVESRAGGFVVHVVVVGAVVGELDLFEGVVFGFDVVGVEGEGLAEERFGVEVVPCVGLIGGEFDVEGADGLVVKGNVDDLLRCAVFNGKKEIGLVDFERAFEIADLGGVGEEEVVGVDMSPTAGGGVDDFDLCGLVLMLFKVEGVP